MQTSTQLSRVIRKGLDRKGISVAQMADRAGLSTSGAYKVINCEGGMPMESTLRAMANVLDLPVEELWDAAQADHRPVGDPWAQWVQQIQDQAAAMTERERAALRRRLLGMTSKPAAV